MGEIHGADSSIPEPYDYSRFLEDWSNGAFYLRGSFVYLYQCKVGVSNLPPSPIIQIVNTVLMSFSKPAIIRPALRFLEAIEGTISAF